MLYIVETDKIANEILADRDGLLEAIMVDVDETVAVGTTLGPWAGGAAVVPPGPPPRTEPEIAAMSAPAPRDHRTAPATGDRVIASPHARKLARERGIELAGLSGTGPGGRIIARDITPKPATQSSPPATDTVGRPLTGSRKVIAERMTRSQRDIPQFYLSASAEITELLWLHESLKQKPGLEQVTLTHWIASAVGLVIAQTPLYRTVCIDDAHVLIPGSDVGIAVAANGTLLAPVARNLGTSGLAENAVQITQMVAAARDGSLRAELLHGGATTVSNLGGHDIEHVFPLINPGQSSILGVGREQKVFRPDTQDAPQLRRELGLVLACDQRVFNGVDGAAMLTGIKKLLEEPLLIIAQARSQD